MTKERLKAIRERVSEETTGIPVKDILESNPGGATSWIEQLLADRAALLGEVDRLTAADVLAGSEKGAGVLKLCKWTEEPDEGFYESACGGRFIFNDQGPSENGFKFCPYCGLALRDAAPSPPSAK